MKRVLNLLCVMFVLMFLVVGLIGCNSQENVESKEKLTYIGMRINPEIELVVDEEGAVVAVNAINEDGETVLAEIELVGMTVEEAAELFTSMAVELGFIDVDTKEAIVYLIADGEDEELVKEYEDKIKDKINKFFNDKGLFGKVSPEELEEYKTLAEEWQVSLKEAKMINRILELYPEMTLEEIFALSFKEKMELIKEECKKHGFTPDIREEYKEEVEKVKEEFKKMFELRKELEELEEKLEDENLTEEERLALQEEYDAKKAEVEALKEEYKEAIEKVKEEKKEKIEESKEHHKDKAQDRREEFEGKIKEHLEEFEKNKEEIERQIEEWRDKFNGGW